MDQRKNVRTNDRRPNTLYPISSTALTLRARTTCLIATMNLFSSDLRL